MADAHSEGSKALNGESPDRQAAHEPQSAARLYVLLQLSLSLNDELDLPVLLERVARSTRDLLRVSDASILLWDAHRQRFEMAASTTTLGGHTAQRVRRSGGASRWIIDHLEPVVVSDTAQDPFTANRILDENELRAYAGVPLEREGVAEGVMYALHDRRREFDADEMQLMHVLAGIATGAIRNARQVRALRRTSELRETMMHLAAHDLRAPLSTMMAYLELLEGEIPPASKEAGEWLGQIWRSLARMQRLTGDVLDYARLTGQGEIDGEPVDLVDILRQSMASVEMQAGQETHRILVRPCAVPAMVEGDPLLLQEVVANLLGNALQHTPEGTTIELFLVPGEQEHVLIVSDDGPGIPPEDQQRSFEPFVHLAGSEGAGLGLSLARTIVERHRGRIDLDRAPEGGAMFTVMLPAWIPMADDGPDTPPLP
jgi:signal transduction histidine kinase